MTVLLLASSVLFGTILLGFIGLYWSRLMRNWKTSLLTIIVLLGILTSLLNHGTDLAAAKWIDRAFMVVSGTTFLVILLEGVARRTYLLALMGSAVLFYAAAKIAQKGAWSDGFHIACHGAATAFIIGTLSSMPAITQ